jgi:hypothetical protein
LSRDLQLNCVISFFFHLHLVLHACAARFDVTGTVALFEFAFWVGDPTKQACANGTCFIFSVEAATCTTAHGHEHGTGRPAPWKPEAANSGMLVLSLYNFRFKFKIQSIKYKYVLVLETYHRC